MLILLLLVMIIAIMGFLILKVSYSEQLREKAEAREAQALYDLGSCFFYGYGITRDDEKALYYWQKAAEPGNACAMYAIGRYYDGGVGIPVDYEAAAEIAAHGQALLPHGLRNGVKPNHQEAMIWLEKAANLQHVGAQIDMGRRLKWLENYQQNPVAFQWFERAALSGNRIAQYELGECYLDGKGEDKDIDKGLQLLLAAAEQEYADAQLSLGRYYQELAEIQHRKAHAMFLKANHNNDRYATGELAECYLYGKGVRRDYTQAVEYLIADYVIHEPFSDAPYLLGVCYYLGWGVNLSLDEAEKWLEIAVEFGNNDAKLLLDSIKGGDGDELPFESSPDLPF